MSNRVEDLYREIQSLPKRLKNHVLALLDPSSGNMANTVVAFWQESILKGGPDALQREVDAIVTHVDDVLASTELWEQLEWISWHQETIVCGTYGGATSFVSNFLSAFPYRVSHEMVYRNDELMLRASMAGFIRGDCSGAAWKYVPHLVKSDLRFVQVLRHPVRACGSMMNNNSNAIPKTFEDCAWYWYDHHTTLEKIEHRYAIRIEDWDRYHKDLMKFLKLDASGPLVQCWQASDGSRSNPRGGARPWTWDDLPDEVQELAKSYGYSP